MSQKQELIKQLLHHLTFGDVDIKYEESEDAYRVVISLPQEESGVLIGYHGEKIDALQLIVSLMLNQDNVAYKPLELDINNYRERRQVSLRNLADKAAAKAVESGREILLPPLPSHERRTIHLHLDARDDVTTYSEGDGSNRRLVVRPV